LIIYSNNAFNVLYIANMLNTTRKIANEKSRKNITTKVNNSERKKSIKTIFDIQKIMQKNNILSYY